jgi:type IV pilus assembly protein PilA
MLDLTDVTPMNFQKSNLMNLSSSQRSNISVQSLTVQGFTLVELLIVIVIVGVLSTIALPSFLSQVSKAKGSEAKSNLGTINRAQQVYRFNKQTFANNLNALSQEGMRISGAHYLYTVSANVNTASTYASPYNNDLRVYAAGVAQGIDSTSAQVVCESLASKGSSSDNDAVVNLSAAPSSSAQCNVGRSIQ